MKKLLHKSHFFFQILLRCGQHQFDAVELVDFAGTGIVIDCHDVGYRIAAAQLFDHAFSYDMVWKAGKWLDTYDIVCPAVDQLQHFSCEKPPFPSLVADRDNRLSIVYQIIDVGRRREMPTLFESPGGGTTQESKGANAKRRQSGVSLAHTEIFCFVNLIIEAVEHKVQKIGDDSFCPFRLQQLYQMVVCSRLKFE